MISEKDSSLISICLWLISVDVAAALSLEITYVGIYSDSTIVNNLFSKISVSGFGYCII